MRLRLLILRGTEGDGGWRIEDGRLRIDSILNLPSSILHLPSSNLEGRKFG